MSAWAREVCRRASRPARSSSSGPECVSGFLGTRGIEPAPDKRDCHVACYDRASVEAFEGYGIGAYLRGLRTWTLVSGCVDMDRRGFRGDRGSYDPGT